MLNQVQIVDMGGDSRSYRWDESKVLTPRQIIADFFHIDLEDVSALLGEKAFRIANRGALLEENFDDPLAPGDTITVYSQEVARSGIRGELSMARFFGIQIDMPYKESCHHLPHFHINGHAASMALDGTLLSGSLDWLTKRQKRLLRLWLLEHRDELRQNWLRRQKGLSIAPIGPWD